MKTSRLLVAGFGLFPLILLTAMSTLASPPVMDLSPITALEQKSNWVSAADVRFRYEGRFDFSDAEAPVIIWQASRISVDFEGSTLTLLFDNARGRNFFNCWVDGSNTVVDVREGAAIQPVTISGFGPGKHQLVIFKRSEAAAGTVRFRGIKILPGAKVWASPRLDHQLKLEFIGDSITVGACNEDGVVDQWENRRTHNSASSYAALTAAAFAADYRNIAVSGMGIATGWVEPKAGEIWDRLYPDSTSPRADLASWTPQIVFLNFGENDASFSSAHGQPFPANYTAGYISLVHAIRLACPAARIILLRGGMFNGANHEPLRRAWESAVKQIEATDQNVSHFVFKHWTRNHPRVADDHAMADELVAWLQSQSFMPPYCK